MMRPWGFSPYESWKVSSCESKRASGTAIAGLVLGTVGAAVGVGAWIFGPVLANQRANGVRDLATAQFNANNQQLSLLTNLLANERAERVAQGYTITNTINDSVSGSQQGSLTAQQAADLSAVQSVQNTLFNQAVLGNMQQCPQKVAIWRDATACGCPGCGN